MRAGEGGREEEGRKEEGKRGRRGSVDSCSVSERRKIKGRKTEKGEEKGELEYLV